MIEKPMKFLDAEKRQPNPAYPWPLLFSGEQPNHETGTTDRFNLLIWHIERCGGSPALTKAVTMTGELQEALRRKMREIRAAMELVLEADELRGDVVAGRAGPEAYLRYVEIADDAINALRHLADSDRL